MTRKQSLQIALGAIIFAILIRVSGGAFSFILSWVPLLLAGWILLKAERKGYANHG